MFKPAIDKSNQLPQKLRTDEPVSKFERGVEAVNWGMETPAMAGTQMKPSQQEPDISRICEECEEEMVQMKVYGTGLSSGSSGDDNSKSIVIQAKLNIGNRGDELESEADDIADKVVMRPENHEDLSMKHVSALPPFNMKPKEKTLQMKPHSGAGDFAHAPARIERMIQSNRGKPLEGQLKDGMEKKMKANFSKVRIHNNSSAHHLNRSLGARAFTHQNDIFFNSGQYNPSTQEGKHLLAHELTHTIQQNGASLYGLIQRATEAGVISTLNTAIAASDKPAYMDALRIENAAHAESPAIYSAIEGHLTAGTITLSEAWQAICILNYGNDTDRPHPWPVTIRNFFEGIILGEYSVASIAPRLKDDILQEAISIAHTQITTSVGGRGMGPFMTYMGKFNSLWDTSSFSGLSNAFDPALDSKGPKTERSRHIFDHLYATDPQVQSDYDNDVTGLNTGSEGMRELVEQYVGPESRNLIASPRIQRLREAFFSQSLISANNLANATYVAFKSTIQPYAQALNEDDREEIENSHQWRLIIDWTVSGPLLKEDLANYLQSAYLTAAAPASTTAIVGMGTNIAGTAATSASGPAPVSAAPPPALTPDQQTFVDNLSLQANNTSITSTDEDTQMELFGQSNRDEAGLALRSRVVIDNPSLHLSNSNSIVPWPSTSTTGGIHRPRVITGTGRGSTVFNAVLTAEHPDGTPIVRTGGAPISPLVVTITDDRYNAFAANMGNRLFRVYVGGDRHWFTTGSSFNYYGGQSTIAVHPLFNGAFSLPDGLTVFSEAEVRQNGSAIANFGPTQFSPGARDSFLGSIVALGPVAPPAPDAMEVTVSFIEGASGGVVFHTITEPFNLNPSLADIAGTPMAAQLSALSAQLTADKTALNTASPIPPIPASGAGTIIDEMLHHGTPQTARIAQTILAGTIVLEPMIIRPDSEAFMSAQVAARHNRWGRNASTHVVFALGDNPLDVAPVANPPNSVEETPSVGAIRWPEPRFSNVIHVHLTRLLNPLTQVSNFSSILNTVVHEAVHLVDIRPNRNTDIERYKTEFRAYWMDGNRDHLSTEFDPTMDNFGPKSEKARAIFRHLYFSSTYSFVKTNYDSNANGFRDQVNAFITPDGINLIVSQKLEDIRSAIAGFGAAYGPPERTTIHDLYHGNVGAGIAAADADDRREISGNRYWRMLVESNGFSTSDLTDIKNDLNIPT
ncbi:MAG: DUF4157 domain-containing protein [Cyclobacteriaceae bacterium]